MENRVRPMTRVCFCPAFRIRSGLFQVKISKMMALGSVLQSPAGERICNAQSRKTGLPSFQIPALFQALKLLYSSDVTSKYVQLATVREDNTPACRTVVFRGFLAGTDDLYFVTVNTEDHEERTRRDTARKMHELAVCQRCSSTRA